MNRDDMNLSPDEREAFEALPRERMPSRILEERTVRALKERGLVRSAPTFIAQRAPWVAAASIAAALALFVSGMAVGQWLGARQTANALASIYPTQAAQAAARVQSTGSAHRAALSDLVEATEAAEPEELTRAQEVALAAFWAAAEQIVRIAPDDPVALRILQEVERARTGEGGSREAERNVVWF